MKRPNFFQLTNGSKANLPFTDKEYESRLKGLRKIMSEKNLDAVVLTSMQNVAYYSGFLYCSFGRPYSCIVTQERNIVVSANNDNQKNPYVYWSGHSFMIAWEDSRNSSESSPEQDIYLQEYYNGDFDYELGDVNLDLLINILDIVILANGVLDNSIIGITFYLSDINKKQYTTLNLIDTLYTLDIYNNSIL